MKEVFTAMKENLDQLMGSLRTVSYSSRATPALCWSARRRNASSAGLAEKSSGTLWSDDFQAMPASWEP